MTTYIEKDIHRFSKDQLLTVNDLIDFKSELIAEKSKLLQQTSLQILQPKVWLKSKEVRELLKVSGGKLLTMRVNGKLPYTRIGGVIYYEFKDIEQMLEKSKFNKATHIPELRERLYGG